MHRHALHGNRGGLKASISRVQLRQLAVLRPWRWLLDLGFNWAIIVLTFYLYHQLDSLWLLPVAMLVIGARQHALGLLTHDGTHRLISRKRWLNDLLTEVFTAWPILVKIDHGYRQWHFEHHRTLGTVKDPELSYRRDPVYRAPVAFRKICLVFLGDCIGLGILDMAKFFKAILPRRFTQYVGPLALWGALLTITIVTNSLWIFFLWLGSLVTTFWAVFRIRTWGEHVGLASRGRETSHRFSAGPVARFLFFPHHTYCHYEHHKWSQIPYYNLPKLRELDRSQQVVSAWRLFTHYAAHNANIAPASQPASKARRAIY